MNPLESFLLQSSGTMKKCSESAISANVQLLSHEKAFTTYQRKNKTIERIGEYINIKNTSSHYGGFMLQKCHNTLIRNMLAYALGDISQRLTFVSGRGDKM